MSAKQSVFVATTLSRHMLEATPDDALTFLRGVARDPQIRQLLSRFGYTDADSEHGWSLLRKVAFMPGKAAPIENPLVSATKELETWQSTMLVVARSALTRLHPEQAAFLFEGLDTSDAAKCVLNASVFLERCTELGSGKDRKATRAADVAALATLEVRGLTKDQRKRIGAVVRLLQTHAAPLPEAPVVTDEERDFAARELRAWLVDWKTVAKVAILRRDLLLSLGIGKRRPRKVADDTPPVATAPVTPAPVVSPAPAAPIEEEHGPRSRAA